MLFSSNYDGSLESYMNDFIDKAAWGLNAIFSNGDGFPKTCVPVLRGHHRREGLQALSANAPSSVRNVWYSAYPHFTTKNIANNESIRSGLVGGDGRGRRRAGGSGASAAANELPQSRLGGAIARQRALGPDMPLQVEDIQGIILRGYGALHSACFLMLADRRTPGRPGLARAARAARRPSSSPTASDTCRQRRLHLRRSEEARPPRRAARHARRRVQGRYGRHGAPLPDPR